MILVKNTDKYLVVIGGATAVGKSALSFKLAEWLGTEILSADSRQIYKELSIGTAKPSPEILSLIRHHFVDELSVREEFSASLFEKQALARLEDIFRDRSVTILCGGTGLYIKALCEGLDEIPSIDKAITSSYNTLWRDRGTEYLWQLLLRRDPKYGAEVDRFNHRRLIRALSVIEYTGRPFSEFLAGEKRKRPFQIVPVLLEMDRAQLYDRINSRVDNMLACGLENEAKMLRDFEDLPSLQTVGYQEWRPYFDGQIDRAETVRLIKRNTRRYAKRQMTWFRNNGVWQTFTPTDIAGIKAFIQMRSRSLFE